MIILKIIGYILLAVLALILLLLIMPLSVEFSFIGEELKYKIRYSFMNFYDSDGKGIILMLMKKKSAKADKKNDSADIKPEKRKKSEFAGDSDEKKAAKKSQTGYDNAEQMDTTENAAADKASEKTEDKKKKEKDSEEKKTLGDRVDFIMKLWSCAKRPVRKIFKGFHISKIYIDFLVVDEDAYICAMRYGQICALTYNLLAQFSQLFSVNFKTVDIQCGFGKEKSRWDGSFNIWFLPVTAVISGVWFLITYIFRVYLPDKSADKRTRKSAEKQKTQPEGGK
ncbi:MAG: hypothetical protein MR434_10585 [Ruminococcus sp.]|nr:hypothetical protein [Ruminococcus sp.]